MSKIQKTKDAFFKKEKQERTEQGLGFSYLRTNQKWSKSDERLALTFKNPAGEHQTSFESNDLDADDCGSI